MSYRHLAAVWKADIQPPTLKLVAATLADRADESGGGLWFSLATIAHRCGVSKRQAQRYMEALVAKGLLVQERRARQHYTPHYRMPLEALEAIARVDAGDSPEAVRVDAGDIPECAQGRHPRRPQVTPKASRGDAGVTQYPQRRPRDGSGGTGAAAAGAADASLPRAPEGVDGDAWARLLRSRRDLDATRLAEQALFHLGAGCCTADLTRAMESLRLTRSHKDLVPRYSRSARPRPAARGHARRLAAGHISHNFDEVEP